LGYRGDLGYNKADVLTLLNLGARDACEEKKRQFSIDRAA